MKSITQERLKEILIYDPTVGRFFWKKKHSGIPMGGEAGSIDGRGTRQVNVDQKIYKEHALVWLWFYGKLGKFVHHINHDQTDNRIENLEESSSKKAAKNKEMLKTNTSGHTGVVRRNRNCFIAQICVDGRGIYLGSFRKISEAIKARAAAEKKYGFHENHGRKLKGGIAV